MIIKTAYSAFKIKEYTHWTLFLHENQCYLGRTYLLAKNTDNNDYIAMSPEEREEFFTIGAAIKSALNVLFAPDKMNYASLGNVFERLHVHFIPRYKNPRIFLGVEFSDKRWGKNYAPYDCSFKVRPDLIVALKSSIQQALKLEISNFS